MTRQMRREGALLDSLPLSDRAKTELVRRMGEPSRHYHTMHHIELIWSRHLAYRGESNLRVAALDIPIALAIAYHDSVYVGGASDNEDRSAAFWLETSAAACPVSEDDRQWVADTIRATAAHIEAARTIDMSDARDFARQWVLDLDLTPLGEAPEVFDANMKRLAAELPHLSAARRDASLLDALRHFAKGRPLYRCRAIAHAFEQQARANFSRYLGDEDSMPQQSEASAPGAVYTAR